MKDLNKHAMVGKRNSLTQNNNYMNFGSTKGAKVDANQSMTADVNGSAVNNSAVAPKKNGADINFNKSMEVNFELLKDTKVSNAYSTHNNNSGTNNITNATTTANTNTNQKPSADKRDTSKNPQTSNLESRIRASKYP